MRCEGPTDPLPHKHCRVDSATFVNGQRITEMTRLSTGDRVIIGQNHFFRFKNPAEAKPKRQTSSGDLLGR